METSEAQQRLLTAAVDAFAEHGFGGTSTRDIATRAGRSPAFVYIHHESKEGLLYAISLQGHKDALGCLRQAFDEVDDPRQRLWTMVFAFSGWHMENAKLARIVQYELRALSEDHRREVVALRRDTHRVMVDALEAGIASGAFSADDVNAAARALLSLGIDLVRWFDPTLQRDPDQVARSNADLAIRMVRV
jgi:AcrR family transcriptional regulator